MIFLEGIKNRDKRKESDKDIHILIKVIFNVNLPIIHINYQ
jgi:hypothetical protein